MESSGNSGSLSLRPMELKILLSAGVILVGIAVAGKFRWLPGAACGAAIAYGNFYLIRKILERAFAGGGTIKRTFIVQYVLKFLALVAVVWLVVRSRRFQVAGLLLGFSSLFLGVLLEGLTRAVTTRQGG
ncbi:MAG: ATP synthase subunit I [Deltaproteobacteria bacterium]|nr:ATP synthase subunit I [Deltaproteobacteria bacterium]